MNIDKVLEPFLRMNDQHPKIILVIETVALMALVLRLWHVIKRRFEQRCPCCGSIWVDFDYYSEPSPNVAWSSRRNLCYDTYKLFTCHCEHEYFGLTTRYMSAGTLRRRKRWHPDHFSRNTRTYQRLVALHAFPQSHLSPLFIAAEQGASIAAPSETDIIHKPKLQTGDIPALPRPSGPPTIIRRQRPAA